VNRVPSLIVQASTMSTHPTSVALHALGARTRREIGTMKEIVGTTAVTTTRATRAKSKHLTSIVIRSHVQRSIRLFCLASVALTAKHVRTTMEIGTIVTVRLDATHFRVLRPFATTLPETAAHRNALGAKTKMTTGTCPVKCGRTSAKHTSASLLVRSKAMMLPALPQPVMVRSLHRRIAAVLCVWIRAVMDMR